MPDVDDLGNRARPRPVGPDGEAAGPGVEEETRSRRVGGRARGSFNFRVEDLNGKLWDEKLLDLLTPALLEVIEEVLPTNPEEWSTVEERFTGWARESNRPGRTHASLLKKYFLTI